MPPAANSIALLPRLSLRKIACFVATADAGSVSAAARHLAVSQASLSEMLMDLEKDLGVDLFIRHKARGVTLTSTGQRLLVEARDLIRHAEEFQALSGDPGAGLTGELIVGCFPTLLPFVMPKLLCGFLARHPGVTLQFVEDSQPKLEEAMLKGTIDLSILYDVDIISAIERRRLFDSAPYVLLSAEHRLANSTDPIDLALLADDPLIQLDLLPGRNDHIFTSLGMTPRTAHRTTNFELVRALVARNVGYAVLVQRPKHDLTYEGLPLVIRPIANTVPPLVAIFAWPANIRLHRRVKAFVDFGVETFQTIAPGTPTGTR